MRLRPLNDTLILKLDKDEYLGDSKTVETLKRGLIVAPDMNTMIKRSDKGSIVKVGSGCKNKYRMDDRVIFRRPSISVEINGEEYRLILEEQILGVLE